jgi:hypothetical protein
VTYRDTDENRDVTGLVQLGVEKIILLDEFRSAVILVGAGAGCHVQIDDKFLSQRQFALTRKGPQWLLNGVPEAKNPTYLNGVPMTVSDVVLTAGAVIRVGELAWVTIGPDHRLGHWYIGARNLDEFFTSALRVYGSARRAAEALGVDQRTYLRHVHQVPEAESILRQQIAARKHGGKHAYRPIFGVPVATVAFRHGEHDDDIANGVPGFIDSDIPYESQRLCS